MYFKNQYKISHLILTVCFSYYLATTGLKARKPSLKVLLAVGGFNARSEGFSAMASTATGRTTFAEQSLSFLRANNFDGLDLDWEYPADAAQGGRPEDRENFSLLLQVKD